MILVINSPSEGNFLICDFVLTVIDVIWVVQGACGVSRFGIIYMHMKRTGDRVEWVSASEQMLHIYFDNARLMQIAFTTTLQCTCPPPSSCILYHSRGECALILDMPVNGFSYL